MSGLAVVGALAGAVAACVPVTGSAAVAVWRRRLLLRLGRRLVALGAAAGLPVLARIRGAAGRLRGLEVVAADARGRQHADFLVAAESAAVRRRHGGLAV